MKNLTGFILIIVFSLAAFAQTPKSKSRNFKKPVSKVSLAGEKEEFEQAKAVSDASDRIAALQKFVVNYPKSSEKTRAFELITSARAALGDAKLQAGDREAGIQLFQTAVREAPQPISDKLFAEVLLQIPTSLFFRGETIAAIDVARLIEEKAEGNARQLLGVATFYLGTENAAEARRLAERAIQLEPTLPAAYQTLGITNRLDFQFEESVAAYQKALDLDANSTVSKRSLAEMKRATGKAAEAVALYREILAKDAADSAAQSGLILALFDTENKIEAETELAKSLEANPNNLSLLVGAAYWYAAREQGAKAVELAEKAVAVEPRYTWARIALARGLLQQKHPFEAEKVLLAARQYGDFPTLDYELAVARFQAGFYREAAEDLQKKFSIKDNLITTRLGGRVERAAKNFTELLAAERRASIFQPSAADNAEIAERLKTLLNFSQKLEASTDETTIAAAEEFIKGDDKMKLHRQLFVGNQLVRKNRAAPKVLELARAAVSGVDAGLDVPDAAAAVLAEELYASRRLAIARNQVVIVPEVPRQTLSNIVRGRIEDMAGSALLQENKTPEAVTRLKRAVSVLPEKSSWWRGSMWRLGTAHEAAGNFKEALDAYVKSYTSDEPDVIKYGVIEAVYQKVNGSADGLEAKIGAKPISTYTVQNKPLEQPKAKIEATPESKPEVIPTPAIREVSPMVAETKTASEVTSSESTVKTETVPPAEVKNEVEIRQPQVKITASQPQIEPKPAVIQQTSENKPKSIFEPIIISVPKIEQAAKAAETTTPIEKTADNEVSPAAAKTDKIFQNKPAESIETRPRVIVTENALPPQCKMNVGIIGRGTISILNNGGNLSILVSLEGDGDVKEIKATSSSPADVEIVPLPPAVGDTRPEIFFIVKSISKKTGMFTVIFESACGKREIPVRVR
jgi:tetratricopeptide (TPR) repeat protein